VNETIPLHSVLNLIIFLVLTIILMCITGCFSTVFVDTFSGPGGEEVIGRTEDYRIAWPTIYYTTDKDIAVGVIDRRPYIVNGSNNSSYVGLMRAKYGNPWHVNTETGQPLSHDLTDAIVSGFKSAGINASSVKLSPEMKKQDGINRFPTGKSDRIILVRIVEWQSDTYTNIVFLYDLNAEVYDENGELLAKACMKNTDDPGERQVVFTPVEAAREVLIKVLNEECISKALQ
jgi:hypothetical protein